ncbi:MAG: hypothetical protein IIV45_07645 [Lachnospiraceae bacterium]|nr:hypothetical protein [Lachnospiraceae bacterium]
MEKKNFITLVFGVIGGLLFSLGMCMALLEEWAMFNEGVILGTIGAALLLLTWLIYCKMYGKKAKKVNWKVVAKTIFGIFAALVFGAGMCMIMVYNMMFYGIIVGVVGILLLLLLIPMCFGLKDSKKEEVIEEN